MGYKIPLFDLHYDQNEIDAVSETLTSKWISMGPRTELFERRFAQHLGARHAVAVCNCTAALHLAMLVTGIGEGDEVIVPSLTFVATVNAVRYVNATPVFADIVSQFDLSIDPADVEHKITGKTKAIIAMHYGGFACNMKRLSDIATKNHIYLIEDAAHAPDSEFEGQKLGAIGNVGCFSFFSNKNISCAEGGMLVTGDDDMAQKARLLRSHGMTTLSYERGKGHATTYDVVDLGFNYRLDDIRAALLLAQIQKLDSDSEKRVQIRWKYIEKLQNNKNIIIPYNHVTYKSSNYIFPIILRQSGSVFRDTVREKLKDKGIETSVHYPPVHRFSIYRNENILLPITEVVGDSLITLPFFFNLSDGEIEYVSDCINNIT